MEIRRIKINDQLIEYQLNYKNIKSLRMHIRQGKIIVNSSYRYSYTQIEAFMMKNKQFILKNMNKYIPKYDYHHQGYVYIFNQRYTIIHDQMNYNHCRIIDDQIFVYGKDIKKIIESYLSEQLKNYAYSIVQGYLNQGLFNCKMPQIVIKRYKSRWGTYYLKEHKISLNLSLAHLSYDLIDSVIMHEMCHTLVMDHSSHFYQEVIERMPDYYTRKKRMKEIEI